MNCGSALHTLREPLRDDVDDDDLVNALIALIETCPVLQSCMNGVFSQGTSQSYQES